MTPTTAVHVQIYYKDQAVNLQLEMHLQPMQVGKTGNAS